MAALLIDDPVIPDEWLITDRQERDPFAGTSKLQAGAVVSERMNSQQER